MSDDKDSLTALQVEEATVAFLDKKYAKAEKLTRAILTQDSKNERSLALLNNLLIIKAKDAIKNEAFSKARLFLDEALNINRKNQEAQELLESIPIEEATSAIRKNELFTARRILRQITSQNSENYRAWMLLSGITPEPSSALHYARRAHALAPHDASVQAALEWAEKKYNEASYSASIKETFILAGDSSASISETSSDSSRDHSLVAEEDPVTTKLGRLFILGILLLGLLAIVCGLYYRYFRDIATTSAQPIAEISPSSPTDEPLVISFPTRTPTPPPQPTETPSPLPPTSTFTPSPSPTNTPVQLPPTATVAPLPSSTPDDTRWIDVNLTTQTLTAYEFGVPVFTTAISSGLPETPTIVGRFRIYYKLPLQHMTGYHLGYDYDTPDVPNVMYFTGDFALHGAYWHDDFGQPASHGCVNLSVPDSEWLYNFAGIGTFVEVHY